MTKERCELILKIVSCFWYYKLGILKMATGEHKRR